MTTEIEIRKLVNAQTCDNAWLFEVANILQINQFELQKDDWDLKHWKPEWGSIERMREEDSERIAVIWHRPDGAQPIASLDLPEAVRVAKFALLACLIPILEKQNKSSYAEVKVTKDWQRATIKMNGKNIVHVLSADALLNTVTVCARDEKGKLIINKAGNVETRTVSGYVEIVIEKEAASFF